LSPFPGPFLDALLFGLGAIVGSFLNVVIARLPEGESIVSPRSRCPGCRTMIPWYLNIPILSWIALRGRCKWCKRPISLRYPVVELLTAALFLAVGRRFGWSLATLAGLILAGSLVAIAFIDMDIWEIPDEIAIPGAVIGVLLRPLAFRVAWYDGLLGAAIGAAFLAGVRGLFFLLRKKEGMGLGDVKLIAMIGAFVGPLGLAPAILVASAVGTVIGGIVLFANRGQLAEPRPPAAAKEDTGPPPAEPSESSAEPPNDDEEDWVPPRGAVPFGPFLAIGALTQFLIGPVLLRAVNALMR
jgi:leader peptidase (prepilin peptidase)/N-methyltransferase